MSTTPGNPHAEEAIFQKNGGNEWISEEGQTEAAMIVNAINCQTEATLAVAYEQRTANLIAFLEYGDGDGYSRNIAQIEDRLALG